MTWFRDVILARGALDSLVGGLGRMVAALGFSTDFIPALPTALMKPLSGRKTRHAVPAGLLADFVGIVAAIFIAYLFFA